MMPKLIPNSGSISSEAGSEFAFENFGPTITIQPTLRISSVSGSLPSMTFADSQLLFVSVSGVLAVTSGSKWGIITADRHIVV